MNDEINRVYRELCSQLGDTEHKIDQLKQKAEQIKKRLESLQWINGQLPVVESIPIRPEGVEVKEPANEQ